LRRKGDLAVALAVVAVVAGGLSLLASAHPDGLEYVAAQEGFEETARQVLSAPVPDYVMPGVASPALATALSGLAGSAVVFAVAWGLARLTAAGSAGSREGRTGTK